MFLKRIYTISFFLLAYSCFAGNPALHGNWKGFIVSNLDVYNSTGLPVSLSIVDDNDEGDLVGEMTVQYRYQTDIYKAKYAIEGNIDYEKYVISLRQTHFVYSDLLPKGLQWCIGGGTFNIYRSTYGKKTYMDGYMKSNCGKEDMRMILIKM
ncbi:MAG: hypothetical protein JWN78_2175 [Bacteroidota bacterium]|nr:hypothetical protein [Bacteroidota bacterium]